jgi:hypothetical protein
MLRSRILAVATALTAALAGGAAVSGAAQAATVAPSPASSSPGVSSDTGCSTGYLPAAVLGTPNVTAGSASGYRIYHDKTGWHIRVTHPGHGTVLFTGTVRAGRPIHATGYKLEAGDHFWLSRDRETLTFAFVNHGAIDGVDFTDACSVWTTFTLDQGLHRQSPSNIWLGAHGVHPLSNPFAIERRG